MRCTCWTPLDILCRPSKWNRSGGRCWT